MAVYIPIKTSHNKRHDSKAGVVGHPHGHHHLHRHGKVSAELQQQRDEHIKRAVGDLVIATIDGQRVSWINSYSGPPAPVPESFPTPNVADDVVFETVLATSFITVSGPCPTTNQALISQHSEAPTSSIAVSIPHPTSNDIHATTGSWVRQAYYNAASGHSKGFTFLNHHGDTHGASGTSDGGAP